MRSWVWVMLRRRVEAIRSLLFVLMGTIAVTRVPDNSRSRLAAVAARPWRSDRLSQHAPDYWPLPTRWRPKRPSGGLQSARPRRESARPGRLPAVHQLHREAAYERVATGTVRKLVATTAVLSGLGLIVLPFALSLFDRAAAG